MKQRGSIINFFDLLLFFALLVVLPLSSCAEKEDITTDEMVSLATMYYNGDSVKQNNELAFSWYQKAADLGDKNAMANLGWMYDLGRGVSQSDTMAVL